MVSPKANILLVSAKSSWLALMTARISTPSLSQVRSVFDNLSTRFFLLIQTPSCVIFDGEIQR